MPASPLKNIHSRHFQVECDEYLLVAHPETGMLNKLKEEHAWFYDCFTDKCTVVEQPHIAIATFVAKEMMEGTLIRWVQRICNVQKSFRVTLNNFCCLPPNTIYVRIQDPEPFRQLGCQLKKLGGFIQSNNCPPLQIISNPLMVIAEDMPEKMYRSVIYEFSSKTFHASFPITRLTLLKRNKKQEAYKLVNAFVLPVDFAAV